MTEFTVYVVDDDSEVRAGVQRIFASVGMSARAYHSAEEFIPQYSATVPSCLILDLRMPGMTGLELIASLRDRKIEIPIIILSGHGDVPSVVDSMKLGAAEFLEKPADPCRLIEVVCRLLKSDMQRFAERARMQGMRDDFAKLTRRENQLLDMLANGLSSKQIAVSVGISIKTVENHRAHVLAKTHATNVASLVRMKMMVSDG